VSEAQYFDGGHQEAVHMPIRPAQDLSVSLMRLIEDPNVPVEKLTLLLTARQQLLDQQAKELYQQAFHDFSAKMRPVTKDGRINLGKGWVPFTSWEHMDAALRPLLHEHGLTLQFTISAGLENHTVVTGILMHVAGHAVQSSLSVPPDTGPGRNQLQAIGSAITYAKRYVAEALCNIIRTGQDDDAASAYLKKLSKDQVTELCDLLKKVGTSEQTFLQLFLTDIQAMEDISQRDFPRLRTALQAKLKQQEKKDAASERNDQ
jgi:hypothetical protein